MKEKDFFWLFVICLGLFIPLMFFVDLVYAHSDFGLTRIFAGLVIGFWFGVIYTKIALVKK